MIAKVTIVAGRCPGVIGAVLRLAEMDVADVDQAPVLLVARRCTLPSPNGSSGMLRFSQAGSCAWIASASVPGRSAT